MCKLKGVIRRHSKSIASLTITQSYHLFFLIGGMSLRHSNSRTDKKNRNGYDHLYRNKSIGVADNGKAVIAMTMNNYNQLDLNTPV